jgi:hypothetical protein
MFGRTRTLNSTTIASARRADGGTIVTFRTGERYWCDIPRVVHQAFIASDSPGRFYSRIIRPSHDVFRIVHGDLRPFNVATMVPAAR